MEALHAWGWDDDWATLLEGRAAAGRPARVIAQERDRWSVRTESGEAPARLPSTSLDGGAPVVGDWVLVTPGPSRADPLSIVDLLPRRTAFVRGSAGDGVHEQVLAANVDLVWVVHGLDTSPNLRRLERYLALAWQSGATPAVLLTKSDLADDPEAAVAAVGRVAFGVPVDAVSTRDPGSVERLRARAAPGRTVVLLGPSGAGKSTLVNLLSGQPVASVGAVRSGDGKGRHTTTRRELFQVAGGALVIDTPGLRELRVLELAEGLERTYPDIAELAGACRFADCRHEVEPGCAVLAAVEEGRLPAERLGSYRKLQAEAAHALRKADPRARKEAISKHKTALKTVKYHPKYRDGG